MSHNSQASALTTAPSFRSIPYFPVHGMGLVLTWLPAEDWAPAAGTMERAVCGINPCTRCIFSQLAPAIKKILTFYFEGKQQQLSVGLKYRHQKAHHISQRFYRDGAQRLRGWAVTENLTTEASREGGSEAPSLHTHALTEGVAASDQVGNVRSHHKRHW